MGNQEEKVEEKKVEGKEKDTKKKNNLIYVVIAVTLFIGIGVWYYFYWQGTNYFKTENAKVTAKVYSVMPTTAGKLVRYTVEQGSAVKENQIIGRVENGSYLRSPIDGEVVKTNATVNQIVTPTTAVAVIADTNDIYIGANIEETDIIKIKEGQEVHVSLDAYPGKTFKAHVAEIEQTTQTALSGNATSFSTSGTYTKVKQLIPVKIRLDDTVSLNGLIGTNATVKIKIR